MKNTQDAPFSAEEIDQGGVKLGWTFWIQWVLANTVGWIVGMSFLWLLGFVIDPFLQGVLEVIGWGVAGAVVGMVFGINEWFIFRPLGTHLLGKWANWWVIATIGGWSTSMIIIVGLGAGEDLGFATTGAVIGISVGVAQWLILRPQAKRAALWGLVNTASWILGLAAIDLLDKAIGFSIAGLISGSITGALLIWLLQNPREQPEITQS
jgi:hypothetical protein